MTPCSKEHELNEIGAASVRFQKELYEGRDGRQPMMVRMERLERVVNVQAKIAMALLIAVMIGAGTLLFKMMCSYQTERMAIHADSMGVRAG